jgi:hypothetical protein
MASLNITGLFIGSDLSSDLHWTWRVTSALANSISFWDDNLFRILTIRGDFTIGANGVPSGTVSQLSLTGPEYGTDVYRIENLSADAAKLFDLVLNAQGPQAMYAYLLGGDDTIVGSWNADTLAGFGGNDAIGAGPGNDTILAGPGNDTIDGGAGSDTVRYAGEFANYRIERVSDSLAVTGLKGDSGTATLANVETILFADKMLLPVEVNGPTGEIFRLYRAALDRTPDAAGLNYWTAQMEKGVDLDTLAGAFIKSMEYGQLYGTGISNTELVGRYYTHILQRAPEKAGLDFWAGVLDQHGASTAEVLAAISESPEHIAISVGLIGIGIVTDIPVMT